MKIKYTEPPFKSPNERNERRQFRYEEDSTLVRTFRTKTGSPTAYATVLFVELY